MPGQPEPPPLALARAVAGELAGLAWAIGGSLLAWRHGVEVSPADLDIVVAEADFDAVSARLRRHMRVLPVGADPRYVTRRFARWEDPVGRRLDVMAGLGVRRGDHGDFVEFRPDATQWFGGLPWMPAEDWVRIYRLLGRPDAAARLQRCVSTFAWTVDPSAGGTDQPRGSKPGNARRNAS